MTGWLIAIIAIAALLLVLLVLLLTGIAQIRVTCRDEVRVGLQILRFRFRLYPNKETAPHPHFCRHPNRTLARELRRQRREERRARKKQQKKQKQAAEAAQLPKPNLTENLSMIRALVKRLYQVTKGKIKIRTLRLHIVVATDDAAKTALLYSGVSTSASLLLNWIDRNLSPIEHYAGEVSVRPDFTGGASGADIDLIFSVSLFRALLIALAMRNSYGEEKTKAQIKAIRRVNKQAQERSN